MDVLLQNKRVKQEKKKTNGLQEKKIKQQQQQKCRRLLESNSGPLDWNASANRCNK